MNNNPVNQINSDSFMLYVDTIIPRTPNLAALYGDLYYYGALDFYTDEYLAMTLEYNAVPIQEDIDHTSLNRLTALGYYSEWFGYGTTRLNQPDERILEYKPLSWEQVGYPGPSTNRSSEVFQYFIMKKRV